MIVTIDPAELVVAGETLRSCAIEVADIGSQLWACTQCSMPEGVQPLIGELVSGADRALDSVAAGLCSYAVDLGNRAQIAVNDSLAAAALVVDSNPPLNNTVSNSGVFGVSVVGGQSGSLFGGVTITNPDGSPVVSSPGESVIFVGGQSGSLFGDFTITNPDGSPVVSSPGETISYIGAPDYRGTPMEGILALADASDRMRLRSQNTINSIVNNPLSSPEAISVALRANGHLGDGVNILLAPSREEVNRALGHIASDSELDAYNPYIRPKPVNIFAPE